MLYAIAARKPRGQEGVERILWWTDQFASLHRFRAVLQQQSKESAVVADFVQELDAVLDRMLGNAFRGRVADDELPTRCCGVSRDRQRSVRRGTAASAAPQAPRVRSGAVLL